MTSKASKRPRKDERYRDRCFPNAEAEVFNPKGGGYAPLPYISREILRHLKGAELRVWILLLTRGGPQSICYPTYEEIMRGAGVETKGTVSKAINRLEKIGLIRVANDSGTRRYLLRDPRLAVERLFDLGDINRDELEEANDLLEKMDLPLIEPKKKAPLIPLPSRKVAQGIK
jgi:DNA-binding MarR family transcriptional regulator